MKEIKKIKTALTLIMMSALMLFTASSCVLKVKKVNYGSVGIKQKFGKLDNKVLQPGLKVYSFGTKLIRVDTRAQMFNAQNQLSRALDGIQLTPELNVYISINEQKVPELLKSYHRTRNLKVSVSTFKYLINPVIEESIAKVVSQSTSFEEVNSNREQFAQKVLLEIKQKLGDYFIVDKTVLAALDMSAETAAVMTERATLRQQLNNKELQLELAKKQIELDSLRAISQKNSNNIIQPSLSDQILQNKKIESFIEIGKQGNSFIITD
jgi:prohibitin 1